MDYPNICNPQINSLEYAQPSNNQSSGQVSYAFHSRQTTHKPRIASVTFKFTKEEYRTFLRFFFGNLNNGLNLFNTNWKDFNRVFFTEGSEMIITKLGENVYQIEGLKIETVNNFKGRI